MPPRILSCDASQISRRASEYRLRYVCCFRVSTCAKLISWWNLIVSVAVLLKYLWTRISSDLHPQSPAVVIFGVLFFALLLLGVHSDSHSVLYHVFLFYMTNIIQGMTITTIMLILGDISFPIPESIEYPKTAMLFAYLIALLIQGFFVLVYYSLYLERCPQQIGV